MPDIQDISVEDVVADGIDLGKTPQEIAAGVHRWRSLTQEWAATAHGDTDPRRYSEGMDKLDEITTGALAGLRQAAASSWLQTNFQDQPDHARDFLASYDVNQGLPQALGGYAKQAEELNSLAADPVWQLPKRRRDWLSIKEPGGNQIGTFQILPKGEGLDILLNYKSGQENKHGRLNIAPVTDDDIKADIAKTQTELEQARRDIQSSLSNAEMPPAFSGDMGFGAAAGADWAVQEAEQRAQQKALRLQTLSGPTARDFLTSERVVEAVKQSPHGKAIGQVALGEDFLRGVAGFYGNTRVAWNDVTNDPEERDLWRGYMSQLKEIMPGSTRLRLNGGVGNFASEAVEGLGGMTPQLATMAATLGSSSMAGLGFTSVQNALRAGGNVLLANSLLQMGVSAYGSNVTDALTRADRLEEDAKKLQARSPEEAANMLRQAEEIRSTYRLTSGLKAASEIGSELIFPEELMLIRGGQSSYGKKLLNAGGKSFVEGVAAELGNQAVNAQAYGEPGSITNLLRAGALEAAAGAPMIAVGSFGGPKQNAPDAQPNAGSVQPTPPAPGVDPNSMAAIAARAGTQEVTWPTGRRPILTDVPDGPPAIQTAPERTETIQEQLNRTAEGKKPATFIPTQTQADVTIPDGLVSTPVNTPEPGVMVHRSEMSPAEVVKAAEEAPGLLMGMGIPDKPADADRAIVLRTAEGTPVLDVAANSETEPQVREALQKMAKEGDSITVESPAAVLQERAGQPRTAARVGEVVTWEGYTGRLIQDGARFAIQTPAGETVEVPNLQEVQRADLKATQAQALAELQQQSQTVEVQESSFQAAPDGSLAIVDSQGNTFVPHNPKLLRSVRPGANGTTEVLVRNPKQPGQVIKLTGKQAANAQDAFIQAAANVEAAGGKVNWGTPAKPRFQFSTLQSIWSQVRVITTARPLQGPRTQTLKGLMDYVRQALESAPLTVTTPDGRTVTLRHNQDGGNVESLYRHLATNENGSPDYTRALWAPRIATTLQNAAVRLQSGNNTVYMARYADRGNLRNMHIVVVSPDGRVLDQGNGPSVLKTAFPRSEKRGLSDRLQNEEATMLPEKKTGPMSASNSRGPTDTQGNISGQSPSVSGSTVWVNSESGITESQVPSLIDEILNAPAQAPTSLLASLKGSLTSLQKAAADAVRILNSQMPGLVSTKVKIFTTVQEFLDSGHLNKDELTPDILAKIQSAEGFYDNLTGDTIVIGENVNLEPGETPRSAVARVILHERVGHEGLNILLATDPEFAARWERFTAQIPETELTAIGTEKGYEELAGDRNLLAFEWFARQVRPGLMSKNPYVNQIWFALKSWLKNVYANFAGHGEFNKELHAIIKLAQQAAINGTSVPTTPEALSHRLQFSIGPWHKKDAPFRVKQLGLRSLLTGTPLPSVLRDITQQTQRDKAALDESFARVGSMIETASNEAAKKTGLPAQTIAEHVNNAFDGVPGAFPTLEAIHEGLAEAVRKGRNMLDDLSNATAHIVPAGPLRDTIVGNIGHWMRRSYAAFDASANWNYDRLREAAEAGKAYQGKDVLRIMKNAAAYIISQDSSRQGQTDAKGLPKKGSELEADFFDLLNRNTWATALIPDGNSARKNVTSLQQRKVIAPEIRLLMGEHTNPLVRFASSASFQIQFVARHEAQVAMRQAGLSTGLWQDQRGGAFNTQIPDNIAWSALSGLWTTEELWKAMSVNNGLNLVGSDITGPLMKLYKAAAGNAKLNLVALNPRAFMVNLTGGLIGSVQTGDMLAPRIVERFTNALKLAKNPKAKTKDVKDAIAVQSRHWEEEQRAFLISSGVLDSGVTLREIQDSSAEHLLNLLGEDNQNATNRALGAAHGAAIGNALGRVAGGVGQVAGIAVGGTVGSVVGGKKIIQFHEWLAEKLLSKPDLIWKVSGYYAQFNTAVAAGLSPTGQAQTWAAERVRNTYPTYDKVPHWVKEVSRLPIYTNFISFLWKLPRNIYWNLRYAVQDLRSGNPALMASGIRRVLGQGAVGALALMAPELAKALVDWGPPDDEKGRIFRRWLLADYEEGKAITFSKWDADGVTYFNHAYVVPQAALAEIAQAVLQSKEPQEVIENFVGRTLQYFGFGQNLFKTVGEAWMNKDRFGNPITADTGVLGTLKRSDHVAEVYTDPGYAKVIQQYIRAAEAGDKEAMTRIEKGVMGIRDRKVTWDKAVTNAYYKLMRQREAIESQAEERIAPHNRHVLTNPGAIMEATNQRLADLQRDLEAFEVDMKSLGVPSLIVRQARKKAHVPPKIGFLELDPAKPGRLRRKK